MTRPAPAVDRTITVLRYLAEHPRQRHTLSALSQALGFNKATMHAMLARLVAHGALVRDQDDKTYVLGPELVTIGRAAEMDRAQALELCQHHAAELRRELDVSCVVTATDDRYSVVLARRDVDRPLFPYLEVGHRRRLVPPVGCVDMAWSRRIAVDAWLASGGIKPGSSQYAAYYELLAGIRRRGYLATTIDQSRMLAQLLDGLRHMDGADQLRTSLEERIDLARLEAQGGDALPAAIKAPIFGSDGRVLLCFALAQFPADATRTEIDRYRNTLLATTQSLSASLHGTPRVPDWADDASGAA